MLFSNLWLTEGGIGERGGTHVGNTQRGQIIALELATPSTHRLSTRRRSALPQMRRHITASTHCSARTARAPSAHSVQSLGSRIVAQIRQTGAGLAFGRHRVLERTLGGEMVAAADTAFNLHFLEGFCLLVFLDGGLLHTAGFVAHGRPENDVLA